jgi:hypothetical protein
MTNDWNPLLHRLVPTRAVSSRCRPGAAPLSPRQAPCSSSPYPLSLPPLACTTPTPLFPIFHCPGSQHHRALPFASHPCRALPARSKHTPLITPMPFCLPQAPEVPVHHRICANEPPPSLPPVRTTIIGLLFDLNCPSLFPILHRDVGAPRVAAGHCGRSSPLDHRRSVHFFVASLSSHRSSEDPTSFHAQAQGIKPGPPRPHTHRQCMHHFTGHAPSVHQAHVRLDWSSSVAGPLGQDGLQGRGPDSAHLCAQD